MATAAIGVPKQRVGVPRGLQESVQEIERSTDGSGEQKELVPGLTKDLEAALLAVVERFENESYPTWRAFYRDYLEAEAFWKDLQNGFYDKAKDEWRVPTAQELLKLGESGQRFTYVTNFYRSWGWALISVLGQKVPTTRFLPADFRREQDVIKARRANDVVPVLQRNNKVKLKNLEAAYFLYTNGVMGSYTRYLVDAERFGTRKVPVYGMQPIEVAPGGFTCPTCLLETPAEDTGAAVCPECGTEMNEADYRPPVMGEAPMVVGEQAVPRGQEVITLHRGLELRLPPWTAEKADWPFLGLVNEVHESQLKHTFGERAKGITGGGGAGDAFGSYDRFARLALVEANATYYTSTNTSLVTTKQYWLRPAAFEQVADADKVEGEPGADGKPTGKSRKQTLKELFPRGVKVTIADGKLLDARAESMDDHWEICTAHEGAGAYKPAIGSSAVSVNRRMNILLNFIMEWVEYSAAGGGGIVNVGLLSIGALTRQRRGPGVWHPVKFPPNVPLSNAMQESKPGQIAGEVFGHLGGLEGMGRDLTGAVPTLTGGTERSLKPTTFLADREQALGKMFGPWAHLQEMWAGTMAKGVREWARYRTEDEAYTLPGTFPGDFEGRVVPIDEVRGGEFEAYPEVSEQFPAMWHQMQAMFLKLLESPDEYIKEIAGHGRNTEFSKAMLGLPDLYIPGQDDRLKQQIEIKLLLQEEPVIEMLPDPVTGQMVTRVTPSRLVDEFEDDHEEHREHVKEWAVSQDGMTAKQGNPQGYLNVIAHGRAHEEVLKRRAMEEAQMMAAAAAPPAKEKKPKEDTREAAIEGSREEMAGNINQGTMPD